MNQFPESARQRLQAQPPGDHPDADLLTAFAEQSLLKGERERVFAHLAVCAACREVVSLALPQEVAAGVTESAGQSWFRWPVLRWTALAATAIAVIAAVSVLVPRNLQQDVSVPAPQPATESKNAQEPTPNTGVSKQAPKVSASNKAPNPVRRQQIETVETASNEKKDSPSTRVMESRDKSAATSVQSAPNVPPVEPQAAKSKLDAAKEEAYDSTAPVQKNAVAGGVVAGQLHDAGPAAQAAPPPPASKKAELNALRQNAPADRAELAAPMVMRKAVSAKPSVRWRVSSTGAIEHSADGESWAITDVDPSVTFHALSSEDGELWAGGTGGSLFHSSDAGRTWTRVKVGAEGMWVSDTITSVTFPSPRTGYVSTASGAVWTTRDGGLNWQRRQ